MGDHIGYAGRREEKFRYPGDKSEVTLEMSWECMEQLVACVQVMGQITRTKMHPALIEFEQVAQAMASGEILGAEGGHSE